MIDFFLAPWKLIYKSRVNIVITLVDDIRRKYAGSVFGMAWLFLLPFLFLAFYSAVYLVVYKVKPDAMTPREYVLFVYIGLMPFLSFSESLTSGAGAFATNRSVLLNAVFPAELLPLRTVLAAQCTFAVGMTFAVLWALAEGRGSLWLLTLPVAVLFHVMFLVGLGWLLSPIYLVFRDLGQLLSFAVLAILVVSPIAYRSDALSPLPRLLMHFNPFYYYLHSYQSIVFDGVAPDWTVFGIGAGSAIFVFSLGFAFCRRAKLVFADYA